MQSKLSETRVWNSTLLGEAIEQAFGVSIKREAVRVKLLELGYSWKRTRYAPGKQADPEVVSEHQASLETLKRGALEEKLTPKYLDQIERAKPGPLGLVQRLLANAKSFVTPGSSAAQASSSRCRRAGARKVA